jgi:hypothetical protein
MWDEIPPYALWSFGLAACGWIVGPFVGYYAGIRSQCVSAKREAKIKALAAIDQIRIDVLACKYLPEIVAPARARLKDPVFTFSSRCGSKRRSRIEGAWQAYQGIGDYDVHPDNPAFRDAHPAADKARPLLLTALQKLREEVYAA